jgi:hypothetical protein
VLVKSASNERGFFDAVVTTHHWILLPYLKSFYQMGEKAIKESVASSTYDATWLHFSFFCGLVRNKKGADDDDDD